MDGRTPLQQLPGIGPGRAAAYATVGVSNVAHLLLRPPRRYLRFDEPVDIADLEPGMVCVLRGEVSRCQASGRRGRTVTKVGFKDATGEVQALVFGPAYLAQGYPVGATLRLLGECKESKGQRAFHVRRTLKEDEAGPPAGESFVAVYDLPDAIPPRTHRHVVGEALRRCHAALSAARPRQPDSWPPAPTLDQVMRWLHRPECEEEWRAARRLLAFEEALRLQRGLWRLRRRRERLTRPVRRLGDLCQRYRAAWPFEWHASQVAAVEDIRRDLEGPRAMARLLTGDVGAGKSAVAFFPLLAAAAAGRQAALLAPTEILARQHHRLLESLCARLDLPAPVLLSRGSRQHQVPPATIAVGTHRLLARPVSFGDLAVVVIDEQHKFGVRQRFHLWAKGARPDLLMVSATPIPRSLGLTLFGHLDHSVLSPRPDALRQVTTELLVGEDRRAVVDRIAAELERGGKVFVVCPAIGSVDPESAPTRVASALQVAPWLRKNLPAPARILVVHGRMETEQKAALLDEFAAARGAVLVATVVVEVGLDVPDASMVVVLGAERFGLSQLHQIRGRVGRRGQAATCLLVSADPGPGTRERLQRFTEVRDGFELAEMDLRLRGPGELLGLRQHGLFRCLYPEVLTDGALMQQARDYLESHPEARKSLESKPFEPRGVATQPWIW